MSHNSESRGLFSFSSSQYAHSPAASGAAIDIKFIEMAVEKLPHDNDGNQLRAKVQVLVQKYVDALNRKLKADFGASQRQFAIDQAETSLTLLKTELQTFDSDKRNADITTNAVRTQLLPIQELLMTRFAAGGGVGEVNVMTASLATIRTVFGIPTQTEINRLRVTNRLQKSDVVEMTRKLKDGGFLANPEYRASNGGTAPPIRKPLNLEPLIEQLIRVLQIPP